MALFLKLTTTQLDSAPVFVNMDLVTAMKPMDSPSSHWTKLECGGDCSYSVAEDIDQIVKMMEPKKTGSWATSSRG
ncbi:hypothetical protein ABIA95_000194 [Bradyrhizobium sp. LA8.1]